MQNPIPAIAVAVRTFGNSKMQEGLRVKAGTRFAVENPSGDLKVLTVARYKQLFFAGLVRPLGEADMAAAPAGRAVEERVGRKIAENAEGDNEKPVERPTQRAAAVREAARKRTQDPEPPAPKRLENPSTPAQPGPNGSPAGSPVSASSSQAAPASNSSKPTSRPRGRRRA